MGLETEGGQPTLQDVCIHALTFGWKVLFAVMVPPSSMYLLPCTRLSKARGYGGPALLCALTAAGLLIALTGDIAGIFGCLIGLPDIIMGITFMTVGSSFPAFFASKDAVLHDPSADATISTILGTNSVIVFLGFGFPWLV